MQYYENCFELYSLHNQMLDKTCRKVQGGSD